MSNTRPNKLPKARSEKLIIKELPDETLVYDLETDEAHCLNQTAALVWKSCDGAKPIEEIQAVLEHETGARVDDSVVWLALDQLEKFNLLEPTAATGFRMPGMSRRDVIRRVGIATVAVPLIVSISTSPAHAQASLLAPGSCCGNPTQCASNNCTQTPTCTSPPPAAPSTKACA